MLDWLKSQCSDLVIVLIEKNKVAFLDEVVGNLLSLFGFEVNNDGLLSSVALSLPSDHHQGRMLWILGFDL